MPSLRGSGVAEGHMRIDKFLWFARIVKTRSLAQELAENGRMRLGGRLVDRAHVPVRVGDVLSFAIHGRVRVLKVEALPKRRGPAAEAQALYTDLSEATAEPLTSKAADD